MKLYLATIGLAALAASSAAVAQTKESAATPPEGGGSVWSMPWQLTPASPASAAQGEKTILAWVSDLGFVRGTPTVLGTLKSPMVPRPGRNAAVEPCREVVLAAAAPSPAPAAPRPFVLPDVLRPSGS